MSAMRVYADTSVFGGCFDDEFSEPSLRFFEKVRSSLFRLVVSDTTLVEIGAAPQRVRGVLLSLPAREVERVGVDKTAMRLRDAYLEAGVVGPASVRDAEHIAVATIADVDLVVSWNFKHIVHYDKIAGYQGVNLINGYRPIRIYSPLEVI